MNHYVKNIILTATLMGAIVGSTDAYASPEKALSVIEATGLIWKMNYKNISTLHEIIFPPKQEDETAVVGLEQRVTDKIGAIRKAISEKIFGKTLVDRVLETFFSASLQEQEAMKRAIQGSYAEYIGFNGFGVLAALIVWPIGIPLLVMHQMDHVKKIEARRGGFEAYYAE
jgi:hypothetical protein